MSNYLIDDEILKCYVPSDVSDQVSLTKHKRLAILSFMSLDRLCFIELLNVIKTHNIYDVTHLSQVHKLLSTYLLDDKPTIKKYSLFTIQIELAFEIIDRLPPNIWYNPQTTILDPSCGTGIFHLAIIHKLMDGLKKWETDPQKRYKHIVENMLYASDLYSKNIFRYECLFDPFDHFNLNTYCGNSIHTNFTLYTQKQWGITKFTAVVGMPPYSGTKYIPFINTFLDMCDYMAYIVPSKMTINTKEVNHLNNLKSNGLSLVKFIEEKTFGIKREFMYFIFDSICQTKLININDIAYIDISEPLHNYKSKLEHSILTKINNLWKVNLDRGENIPLKYRATSETPDIKFSPSNKFSVKMVSRLGGGKKPEYHYIRKDKSKDHCDKLAFTRSTANYGRKGNYLNLNRDFASNIFVPSDIAISRSIMYIPVKNREESERMSWYIGRSLWVRYVFLKYNTFQELTIKMFEGFIPRIPLNKIMTDDEVFRFFKLTDQEIQHITNVVYDL